MAEEKPALRHISGLQLEDVMTITCKTHGDFRMKVGDHLGVNEEKVPYGCPRCEALKMCEEELNKQQEALSRLQEEECFDD
tara:strand:+ start:202 stop:444 length:243 start_codon:yes stop_codon:yes gene_type:complete